MKPLERLTRRATFRTGIIVFGATMCLALLSTTARREGVTVRAATAVGSVSVMPAACTRPIGAATSRYESTRNCSRRSCARHSNPFASSRLVRKRAFR